MLKSKLNQLREKDGFTIIEVIIVLVIAAIIMLAVFLVVPQLQRTQRNSRNQDNARRALTAVTQFSANNNGAAPTTSSDITNITGDMKIGGSTVNSSVAIGTTATATPAGPAKLEVGNITVYTNAKCSGSTKAVLSSSGQTAVIVGLESGTVSTPQAVTTVAFCTEV